MEIKEAAESLGALAQETRLDLLRLLIKRGPSGMAAGDLAAAIGIPASTLSFHLGALERAGLTTATRQGRNVIHAVREPGLRGLLAFLTKDCCGGRPELCGDLARLLPEPAPDAVRPAFHVLFLCSRNSARSIMAEAILSRVGGGRFRAYSAGADPAPAPLPEVLERLSVLGHDVSGLRSKSLDAFTREGAPPMDFVIALCDVPEGQPCPDFGGVALTAQWPLPDPARFEAGPQRVLLVNELYASLRRRIEAFVGLPFGNLSRRAAQERLEALADVIAA
ncbi:metalloregulator ArsR/SmtB family transcription factor [Roseicella sp. DB1501]|uniref:metalloregulator ArsR/SmtB family transcription factor n=1 Tax=Roseicella sp. DB1501 TaxID=2730925 RepID=UPI0014927D9E|nr:metalloregulator ArsR/SmtB family transcription factor [Roseicella sp. DB1501]NOG73637.1 metalloregulator ArsR/SmtB family transcription factor [Roseicella sp. DB1501]